MKRIAAGPAANGLAFAVDGGVARLRLERPRRGNRIDVGLAQAICAAVEDVEMDDGVHVVVLSAAGSNFCLGAEDGEDWSGRADCVAAIGSLTRPVVGVVQGDAVAEGCELALACDLRLCATGAGFVLPQLRDGRLPKHGGTQRLPRLVGRTRALDLLLTGRRLAAREALEWGLASAVVAGSRLAAAAERLTKELSQKGSLALRYAKETVVKGGDMTLEQGIRLEEDLYVLLQTTADRREGVAAFLNKRAPRFSGN